VALCHFCELHGPTTIMVTQTVRAPKKTSEHEDLESNFSDLELLFGENQSEKSGLPGCPGCWSLGGEDGRKYLLSREEGVPGVGGSRRCLVSSQEVLGHQLQPLLRHAVIRAISCENCPSKEGTFLFSDPSVSTALAHNFFLRDSRARGFQRYYSIVVLARDQEHLVRNWTRLSSEVCESVINSLKLKTREKFESETKSLLDLKDRCEVQKESTSSQRRGSSRPARNLRELSADPEIFAFLHGAFSHLICLVENGLRETVLSGQPMRSSVTFPLGSLPLLLSLLSQLGSASFKVLLLLLLSGERLQVISSSRPLAKRVAEGLCILLPNNLRVNVPCFANVLVANQDIEEENSPKLRVEENTSHELQFQFEYENSIHTSINSTFVNSFMKIFSNQQLPETIREMTLRSYCEKVLLQARVFKEIKGEGERKKFLQENGFTATDTKILTFFIIFS